MKMSNPLKDWSSRRPARTSCGQACNQSQFGKEEYSMKHIDSVKQYGGTILEKWIFNDNFDVSVSRRDGKVFIAIGNDEGLCTGCIYQKFILKYDKQYDINYVGVAPPTISCKEEDFEKIMNLLELINKDNLYFDDVR